MCPDRNVTCKLYDVNNTQLIKPDSKSKMAAPIHSRHLQSYDVTPHVRQNKHGGHDLPVSTKQQKDIVSNSSYVDVPAQIMLKLQNNNARAPQQPAPPDTAPAAARDTLQPATAPTGLHHNNPVSSPFGAIRQMCEDNTINPDIDISPNAFKDHRSQF